MINPAFYSSDPCDPCPDAVGELGCCSICHAGYFQQHEVLVTPCNHRYHEYCITERLKTRDIAERTCAVCHSIAVPLVRESSSLFGDDKETNPFIESAILRSVRLGQRDFIAQLLVSNPEIANQRFLSSVSGNKVSLLYIAAQEGHLELATDLLASGAQVDAPLNNGSTPLFIAVQKGHRKLVALLVDAGASVDARRKNGSTPLHIAVEEGDQELADILLKYGAWVNVARNDGATPLHIAAQTGNLGIAVQLLDAGALVNATCENDSTPLYIATQNGHRELADILLKYGAWVNAARKGGITPLYIAAQNGHRELVANLLVAGAEPGKQSAIQAARQNHHDDIAQMLTDRKRFGRGEVVTSGQTSPQTVIPANAGMTVRYQASSDANASLISG